MDTQDLLARPLARFGERRCFVHERTAAEDRLQQIERAGPVGKDLLPHRIGGIDDGLNASGRSQLVVNHVAEKSAVRFEPAHLQDPRRRDLRGLFREFDPMLPLSTLVADRAQLVDAAERGLIPTRDEARSHAPYIDLRSLLAKAGDDRFVEIVAGEDDRGRKPSGIENPARLDAQIRQISGVDAYAEEVVAGGAKTAADLHGLPHPLERVVCVHEQNGIVRHRPRVRLERAHLVIERHHPAVRVGPAYRDAVANTGQYVRRGVHAADVSGTRSRKGTVRSLGAAQTELENLTAVGGQTDTGRLRGDETLEVDDVQQCRLDQLSLQQRTANAQQRLVLKNDGALRERIDIALEPQAAEIFEESAVEQCRAVARPERSEVVDLALSEGEVLQILDGRPETRRDRESRLERVFAKREMEDRFAPVDAFLPVPVSH